jgi:hypothetical protein
MNWHNYALHKGVHLLDRVTMHWVKYHPALGVVDVAEAAEVAVVAEDRIASNEGTVDHSDSMTW